MTADFTYTTAGALTGFVVGLTGVGGGALMTPLLLLVWGISPVTAVATDLWFAAITKVVGASVHHQAGNVDWHVAGRFWLGSLPMAMVVVVVIRAFQSHDHFAWLNTLIATVIMLTAISMILGPHKLAHALGSRFSGGHAPTRLHGPVSIAFGAVLGLLVTLTSIGAGALGAVFLLWLYPERMTPQRLVATDIVHAIPLTMIAGSGYLAAGLVDVHMLGSLLLGSIPAVLIGSRVSRRLRSGTLRGILAVLLMGSGLKLLLT